MGFLTNWLFWLILITIIFILALIGYLTENKDKSENENIKSDEQEQPQSISVVPSIDSSNVMVPVNNEDTFNFGSDTWNNQVNQEPIQPVEMQDFAAQPAVAPEPINLEPVQPENLEPVMRDNDFVQPVEQSVPTVGPVEVQDFAAQPAVEPEPINLEPVQSVSLQPETMSTVEPVQPVSPIPTVEPVSSNGVSDLNDETLNMENNNIWNS